VLEHNIEAGDHSEAGAKSVKNGNIREAGSVQGELSEQIVFSVSGKAEDGFLSIFDAQTKSS
jgi:hypothetical protein